MIFILIKVRITENIIYWGRRELSADPVIQLIQYEWPYMITKSFCHPDNEAHAKSYSVKLENLSEISFQ